MTHHQIEEIVRKHLTNHVHRVSETLVGGYPCVIIILIKPLWFDFVYKARVVDMIREVNAKRPAGLCVEYCYWR